MGYNDFDHRGKITLSANAYVFSAIVATIITPMNNKERTLMIKSIIFVLLLNYLSYLKL